MGSFLDKKLEKSFWNLKYFRKKSGGTYRRIALRPPVRIVGGSPREIFSETPDDRRNY